MVADTRYYGISLVRERPCCGAVSFASENRFSEASPARAAAESACIGKKARGKLMLKMKLTAQLAVLGICGAMVVGVALAAPSSVVKVKLCDPSCGDTDHMELQASRTAVPAGAVTFMVHNDSTVMVHEMVLLGPAPDARPLPYVETDQKVDEEKAKHLGEVSDLPPGKDGALTIELRPGTYYMICNQPGHFKAGMYQKLVVG